RERDEATAVLRSAGCRVNSFVPGTLVLLADGTHTPIEDIQLGDEVLASDPDTGEIGPQRVVATITS
ncbi:Hint domain-containing protein, partial [Actinoalloteichus caeruleus]